MNNGITTTAARPLIPNAVTLAGNVVDLTLSGTGSFTFSGAVTGGGSTVATLTTNATTTINGIVGPAAFTPTLIKQGTATLALAGVNTFAAGEVLIGNGILVAQNTAALGAVANKVLVANGATLQIQQISAAVALGAYPTTVIGTGYTGTTGAIEMLGGGTGANTATAVVTLIGDTTIGVDVGQLSMTGVISGAAAITKVGLGMLSLGGANTYNGLTTVSAGILEANVAAALGAITAGTVVAKRRHAATESRVARGAANR